MQVRDFVGKVGPSPAILFIELTSLWVSLGTVTFSCVKENVASLVSFAMEITVDHPAGELLERVKVLCGAQCTRVCRIFVDNAKASVTKNRMGQTILFISRSICLSLRMESWGDPLPSPAPMLVCKMPLSRLCPQC